MLDAAQLIYQGVRHARFERFVAGVSGERLKRQHRNGFHLSPSRFLCWSTFHQKITREAQPEQSYQRNDYQKTRLSSKWSFGKPISDECLSCLLNCNSFIAG